MIKSIFIERNRTIYALALIFSIFLLISTPIFAENSAVSDIVESNNSSRAGNESNADTDVIYDGSAEDGVFAVESQNNGAMLWTIIALAIIAAIIIAIIVMIPGKEQK